MYIYTYKGKANQLGIKKKQTQSTSRHSESYAVTRSVCSMCALVEQCFQSSNTLLIVEAECFLQVCSTSDYPQTSDVI